MDEGLIPNNYQYCDNKSSISYSKDNLGQSLFMTANEPQANTLCDLTIPIY